MQARPAKYIKQEILSDTKSRSFKMSKVIFAIAAAASVVAMAFVSPAAMAITAAIGGAAI
jgi:hypothetical protein